MTLFILGCFVGGCAGTLLTWLILRAGTGGLYEEAYQLGLERGRKESKTLDEPERKA